MLTKSEFIKKISDLENKCLLRDSSTGSFPTKGGDGGDDCLWLGLLSSTNLAIASKGLLECQGSSGMFYRNPVRRDTNNSGYVHYFSKDMALGVLCHYATYDQTNQGSATLISRDKWINWILNNRACAVRKPKWMGGGCLVKSPLYRFAPDDRSDITPAMWAVMERVWSSNTWSCTDQMKSYEGADGDWSVIEAQTVPVGYQLHLQAVVAYIKWKINQSREYRKKISSICYERSPENLFYKILSQEEVNDPEVEAFMDILPDLESFVPKDTWLWEKSNVSERIANKDYCGWDLVFLGRLIATHYWN